MRTRCSYRCSAIAVLRSPRRGVLFIPLLQRLAICAQLLAIALHHHAMSDNTRTRTYTHTRTDTDTDTDTRTDTGTDTDTDTYTGTDTDTQTHTYSHTHTHTHTCLKICTRQQKPQKCHSTTMHPPPNLLRKPFQHNHNRNPPAPPPKTRQCSRQQRSGGVQMSGYVWENFGEKRAHCHSTSLHTGGGGEGLVFFGFSWTCHVRGGKEAHVTVTESVCHPCVS